MSFITGVISDKAANDFLRPTKITVVAFFVFACGFFYLYYVYGFIDIINTFLIGDPADYKENFTAEGDPWALGVSFQLTAFLSLLYLLASFVSRIFHKLAKRI